LTSKKDEIKEKVNDCEDILHKLPNNYFMEEDEDEDYENNYNFN
jgi:hypothetical protein